LTNSNQSIFFSYSRSDAEFAHKLAKDLQDQGYKIWIDQVSVEAGSRWDKEVEKALISTDILLIILSPESVSSENVMDEFAFALEENKKIIPVLFKECKVPLRLRRLQYIDFTKEYSVSVKQLIKSINNEDRSEQIIENIEPRVKKGKSSKIPYYYYVIPILMLVLILIGKDLIFPPDIKTNGNTNNSAGTSTGSNTQNLPIGKWTGELDLNIGGRYQTILNISANGSTLEIIGSNDECAGDLELREQGPSSVTYKYIKTQTKKGSCFPVGTIILNRINENNLQYLWYSDDQMAQVKGTLTRE